MRLDSNWERDTQLRPSVIIDVVSEGIVQLMHTWQSGGEMIECNSLENVVPHVPCAGAACAGISPVASHDQE